MTGNDIFQVDELRTALQAHVSPPPAPAQNKRSTAPSTTEPASSSSSSSNLVDATTHKYDRWTLLDDRTIEYGYLGRTYGSGISQSGKGGGLYLTTAINYTNGPAHIGHAYESATSDVLARFHRLVGTQPVYFVTGTDEHGQKIAQTAADMNQTPMDICDKYVTGFQVLNQRIRITNDDFIRTTSDRHKATAQALWNKCAATGDIYLDTYQGWYNVKEETFVTDNEAALLDYKCPNSGQPLKRVEEESYFFKMSSYQARLMEHIETHFEFIQPEAHRNAILTRLRSEELRDLSISRTTFDWGIPVPDGFRDNHVMYVWLDALSNYLTGVNALGVNNGSGSTAQPGLEHFWPAHVHIIGKDILWFHTVIWPCLLMSASLPLPRTVFAHGFVNDREGKKMSKSLGNVVDPHDMLDKYHSDTFRWYLCKEAPYGGELSFSEDSMRDMHNADLCDTLGNLVHRATNLCGKYCGGVVPDVAAPEKGPVDWEAAIQLFTDKMDKFELQGGANAAIQGFRDVNGYLQDSAPWALKGDDHSETRQVIVRATLEAIYALAHLLMPFLPHGAAAIFSKLHTPPVDIKELGRSCRNLKVGTKIEVGDVLYTKVISESEQKDTTRVVVPKKESYEEAQRRKKEAKSKNAAKSKEGQATETDQPEFTKIDIRVGKIVKVWNHPEADKLFCEEIDVGEDKPRAIASGLRDHYKLEEMQDRKVLVVCNLKSVKMVGFESQGMVLAAKSADGTKVELISTPEDAKVGERVFIAGLAGEPYSATQTKKKKTWDVVAKSLKTGTGGVATWDGKTIETTAGPCSAPTLVWAPIS